MNVKLIEVGWYGLSSWTEETMRTWKGEGYASETVIFSGTLLKEGSLVATLPSVRVVVGQPYKDGVLIGHASNPIWSDVNVDADTLELHAETEAGNTGWTHTIYVNGTKVGLIFDGGWAVPKDYIFKTPTELRFEDWLPASPMVGPPLPKWLGLTWPWYKEG